VIEWFTWVQACFAVAVGVIAIVLGLIGKKPNDLTMGATAFVAVLLVAQLVIAIVSPVFGNTPTGNVLEFYTYLVTAILIPPLAIIYGLVDRTRWSTAVLGVACCAVAVMVVRMNQIWFVQVA